MRAAGIQSPIPQRKDKNICRPQRRGRGQQLDRCFPIDRRAQQARDQQYNGCYHRDRYNTCDDKTEEPVESTIIPPMRYDGRYQQDHDNDEERPPGTDDQPFGKRCIYTANGEDRDKCGPSWLGIVSYLFYFGFLAHYVIGSMLFAVNISFLTPRA